MLTTVTVVHGLELRGAYGRETKMEDWRSGKDFKITGGLYCSNRDLEEIKKEGFDVLEFVDRQGTLIERIIISDRLTDLTESAATSTFLRV